MTVVVTGIKTVHQHEVQQGVSTLKPGPQVHKIVVNHESGFDA